MRNYQKVILNYLQEESCVIMLGPQVAKNESNQTIYEAFKTHVFEQTDLQLEPDLDGLFAFQEDNLRPFLYAELKEFYAKATVSNREVYEMITQIPWHMYVSISPDHYLQQAFEEAKFSYTFKYYDKKINPPDIKLPSKERPLIYNLFGSIQSEESLIFSQDDLFEYLFSLLGERTELPKGLRMKLNQTKVFFFIGFDFQTWYLKLLLRLLGVHKALPIVSQSNLKGVPAKAFYIRNMKMQFIEEDPLAFLGELKEACSQAGILRKPIVSKHLKVIQEVKALIAQAKIDETFQRLHQFIEDSENLELMDELDQELTAIESEYRRLQRKIRKGVLSSEEERIAENRIVFSLSDFTSQLN